MGPEILIVGDRTYRGELVPRVQDLGYAVAPVRERELLARVALRRPAAVIVCLGGGDTGALVQALRGSREGAAIPVLLVGRLQGELRDFAEVLELGADRFLEAPVDPAELEAALAELAGPPQFGATTPVQRESPARDAGDPVLDRLHQTLAGLAARLEAEAPAEGERDAIDLEAMGLDAVPDVDREHPAAGEFEFLRPPRRLPERLPEPAEEAPPAPRARERTEPLPRAPRTAGLPNAAAGRGDPDSPTLRLTKPSRHEDGPREADAPVRRDASERTVPVVTAAREDVRRDRTEQRRPLAEREAERRPVGARAETGSQTGRWRVEAGGERERHGRMGMSEGAGPGRGEESRGQRAVGEGAVGRRREEVEARPAREDAAPRRESWPEGQVRGGVVRARRPEFDGAEARERTDGRARREDGGSGDDSRTAGGRHEEERRGGGAGEESPVEARERAGRRGPRAEEGWPEGQERGERAGRRFGEPGQGRGERSARRFGAEESWPEGQERGGAGRGFAADEGRPELDGRGERAGRGFATDEGRELDGRGERAGRGFATDEGRPELDGRGERAGRGFATDEGRELDGRGERAGRGFATDEGRPELEGRGERSGRFEARVARPAGREDEQRGERSRRRLGVERDWPEGQQDDAGRPRRRFGAERDWPEGQQDDEGRPRRRFGPEEDWPRGKDDERSVRRFAAEEGWPEGQGRDEIRGERERAGRRWGGEPRGDEVRPEGQERAAARGERRPGSRSDAVTRAEEWPEGQDRAATRERAQTGRRWDVEGGADEEEQAADRRERGRPVRRADAPTVQEPVRERAGPGRRWDAGDTSSETSWPQGQRRGEARGGRRRDEVEEQDRRADTRAGAGTRGRWDSEEDAADGWPEGQGASTVARRAADSERSEGPRTPTAVAKAPIGRRDEVTSGGRSRWGQDAALRGGPERAPERGPQERAEAERPTRRGWPEGQEDAPVVGAEDEAARGRGFGTQRRRESERGEAERPGRRGWPEGQEDVPVVGAEDEAARGRGFGTQRLGRESDRQRGAAERAGRRGWPEGQEDAPVVGAEDEAPRGRGFGTQRLGRESDRQRGAERPVLRRWPERQDDAPAVGAADEAQERGLAAQREEREGGQERGWRERAAASRPGRRGWPEGQEDVPAGGADESAARAWPAGQRGVPAGGADESGERDWSEKQEDDESAERGWPEGQEDAPTVGAEAQLGEGEFEEEERQDAEVSEGAWSKGQVERGSPGSGGLAAVALPALPEAGERGEGDAVELLAELHRERFSGCLQVFAGPERRLWWSEGQVIGGASEGGSESVLGRLSARGLLGATHLELAIRWSTGEPRRDVERLAQAGLLKPQEVQEALREPVRWIVAAILARGTVAWALHPGERPAVAIELGVPLAALLAEAVREAAGEQLRAAVPDEVRPRIGLVGPEALAAELRWPELADIAGRFDGEATIGELVASAAADEAELRAAARVLGLLGYLAPVGAREEESLLALDRRRVRERLRLARETDYFGLLGLTRAASRAEVRRAHADLSATFREGLEPASRAELADELAELYAALDEARDVLTDEALHSAYLGHIGEG